MANLTEIKKLAPNYGFEIVEKGVQSAADIPAAAASLVTQVDCINNFTDNLVVDNLSVVLDQANGAKIPVYGSEIEQVAKGCLASESLDYVALGEATGELAAKVLGGEKAADTAVILVKDSFPVYNGDVAAQPWEHRPGGLRLRPKHRREVSAPILPDEGRYQIKVGMAWISF